MKSAPGLQTCFNTCLDIVLVVKCQEVACRFGCMGRCSYTGCSQIYGHYMTAPTQYLGIIKRDPNFGKYPYHVQNSHKTDQQTGNAARRSASVHVFEVYPPTLDQKSLRKSDVGSYGACMRLSCMGYTNVYLGTEGISRPRRRVFVRRLFCKCSLQGGA